MSILFTKGLSMLFSSLNHTKKNKYAELEEQKKSWNLLQTSVVW